MDRILYVLVTLIISINHYTRATTQTINVEHIKQDITVVPLKSTFNELINPMSHIKYMDHLLTRRKGDIKYYELKVYWKVFIENLDEKRRNPDQVMLNKRKLIA